MISLDKDEFFKNASKYLDGNAQYMVKLAPGKIVLISVQVIYATNMTETIDELSSEGDNFRNN